ncbi:hypothetical protein [Chryseobacterium polytrichastri]|uniref:Uncharacterized protein n=1 Tax=Chryseobacterium polytrichastri TaxID=1302687 RepID=A0A1M6TBB2_9FLAO|nr:hypothetical protein [Chryseobacterium polytrichastri]SHK54342.1 hypothetical protein SAMN05444267_100543 [Chryseobacterium polytrichastri]
MKKFFHYTTELKLQEIIDSGVIKLATKSTFHKKEKPVAWVSINPIWENTATKMTVKDGIIQNMTFQEQLEQLGCARIQVENVGFEGWRKLKHTAKMNMDIASRMELVGAKCGASSGEWFGLLFPIKKQYWIKAEVFRNDEWVLYENFEKMN